MTENTNGACTYVSTWRERMWRRLGFHYHFGDEPEGLEEEWQGWHCTESVLRFSFADRLRLLVRGELKTRTVSYYNTPSPDKIRNRMDWHIVPGGR